MWSITLKKICSTTALFAEVDLKVNLKNPYISVCLQTHPPDSTYLVHAVFNYAFTFGDHWEMARKN